MSSASTPAADPGQAPGPRRHRRIWQLSLALAISAAALYWALRGTDPSAIAQAVREADVALFLLSSVCVTLAFPARAERSRWLLGAATGKKPAWLPVWRATAIGFMANNVLPLRAGEVARGYATGRLAGLPVSTALSTIAVERVFDGIVLMLLLSLGIAAPGFPAGATVGHTSLSSLAAFTAGLFVAALGVLAIVAHWPQLLAPLHALVRRTLSERAAAWATRVIDGLLGGLSVLRRGGDFMRVLVWSLVVWLLNAASYVLAFRAFHLDAVPASAGLVLQGVVALGVAAPSSPGFVGVFEWFCTITLAFYGVAASAAAAFALAVHLAWFVPITSLGFMALARAGLSMHDIRGTRERA